MLVVANADAYCSDVVVADLPFEAPPDIVVGPNFINQPIVADGTTLVKGKISSTKLDVLDSATWYRTWP